MDIYDIVEYKYSNMFMIYNGDNIHHARHSLAALAHDGAHCLASRRLSALTHCAAEVFATFVRKALLRLCGESAEAIYIYIYIYTYICSFNSHWSFNYTTNIKNNIFIFIYILIITKHEYI